MDHLLGLKENVIIGKLIPAGTGMERYRNIDIKRTQPYTDPILAELEMAAKASESRRNAETAEDEDEVADELLADNDVMEDEDTLTDEIGDDDLLSEDDDEDEDSRI